MAQFRSRSRAGFNDTVDMSCDFFRRCAPENPTSNAPLIDRPQPPKGCECGKPDNFLLWLAIGLLYWHALQK